MNTMSSLQHVIIYGILHFYKMAWMNYRLYNFYFFYFYYFIFFTTAIADTGKYNCAFVLATMGKYFPTKKMKIHPGISIPLLMSFIPTFESSMNVDENY